MSISLTQTAAAELLRATQKEVSRWENGESLPDWSQIQPVAEFLGTHPDAIGKLVSDAKTAGTVDIELEILGDVSAVTDDIRAQLAAIIKTVEQLSEEVEVRITRVSTPPERDERRSSP